MIQDNDSKEFLTTHGLRLLSIGLVLIAAVGCGNGLAKVTGKVTIDGTPLAGKELVEAKILFYPESSSGAPAIGKLDEDGNYRLTTGSQKGANPGSYMVSISATEIIPAKTENGLASGRRLTPSKYANPRTSGFKVLVESGSNSFDFELEPEPKRSSRVSRRQ